MDTENCSDIPLPTMDEYTEHMDTTDKVLVILCACLTLLQVGIYVDELVFLHRKLADWRPRHLASWLLSLYPVMSFISMAAILLPRTSHINDLMIAIFLSATVYMFNKMEVLHFGGKVKMVETLSGDTIPTHSPPCCCCVCLPTPKVTSSGLQKLHILIYQFVFITPVCAYLNTAIAVNNNKKADSKLSVGPGFALNIINTASTLLALFGLVVILRLIKERLPSSVQIMKKFGVFKVVLVFNHMQHVIFDFLALVGVIKCKFPLNASANKLRLFHIVLIFEMSLISLLARRLYRKLPDETYSDELDEKTNRALESPVKSDTSTYDLSELKTPERFIPSEHNSGGPHVNNNI